MRKIDKIVLHCSASSFGDVDTITSWHIERGFETIGYHYVILNGYRKNKKYLEEDNGVLEIGRDIEVIGAHARGDNATSIGICLIGNKEFTDEQFAELKRLLNELMKRYDIPLSNVIGHYGTASGISGGKTCPNFNVENLRTEL